MSKVFIVDDNGVIIEELIAYASYRSDKGIVVKPATPEEEKRIRAISENAKRIRELEKSLKEIDQQLNSAQQKAAQQKLAHEALILQREGMAAEMQAKQRFNDAAEKIRQLQEQAVEMQIAVIETNTNEGKETNEVKMDELTDNGLSAISKELDQLSSTFKSDDPEHVRDIMKILADIERRMNALPEMARLAFLRLNVRMELEEQVRSRLAKASWQVSMRQEGDVGVPAILGVENVIGEKAAIIFELGGQVRIETPGFAAETRQVLQQLVLNILRDSGMTHAEGRCTDHSSAAASDVKQVKRAYGEDERKDMQL